MNDTTHQAAAAGGGPKRLVRTPDRKIAGVAAGIAHYLGVDPTIVRIAFVALAFAGGVGLLLYAICFLVMPKGEIDGRGAAPHLDGPTIAGLVGLAVGVPLLIGWHGIDGGVRTVIAIALVVGGILLLGRRGADGGGDSGGGTPAAPLPPPAPPAPPPADPAPAAGPPPDAEAVTAAMPTRPVLPDAPREAAPAASRRGVGMLVLGLAVLAGAAMAALALSDDAEISAATGLAVALVIVGAGLAASAFTGGAPALAVLGALLTCALIVAAGLRGLVEHGLGHRTVAPVTIDELGPEVVYGIGDLTVDLRAIDLGGVTRDLRVALGIGELEVVVPDDVDLDVHGTVQGGEIRLPDGGSVDGWDRRVDWTDDVEGDTGRLRLDLDLEFGEAVVRRG